MAAVVSTLLGAALAEGCCGPLPDPVLGEIESGRYEEYYEPEILPEGDIRISSDEMTFEYRGADDRRYLVTYEVTDSVFKEPWE